MPTITRGEAVEMYARYWVARHGRGGSKLARETASSLQRKGDLEGHKIWNEVAEAIDRKAQRG